MQLNPQPLADDIIPAGPVLLPHQAAWLRRPELDQSGLEIWEMPCGRLYAHAPEDGPLILILSCRI